MRCGFHLAGLCRRRNFSLAVRANNPASLGLGLLQQRFTAPRNKPLRFTCRNALSLNVTQFNTAFSSLLLLIHALALFQFFNCRVFLVLVGQSFVACTLQTGTQVLRAGSAGKLGKV